MQPLIMAPLRGYTDAVFRNVFQRHFKGVDEAVAPFITSVKGSRINPSHLQDLMPAVNRALPVVPQILSNDADALIRLADALTDLGYDEINWNLGCPYPMVANKMRGSGLLQRPDLVDRILHRVCRRFAGRLSLKIRLGRHEAAEIDRLVPVFNRYPLARVIIHPRTGRQMYEGTVDLDAFGGCLADIVHPVVYNGDINDVATLRDLEARFSDVSGWMLGRGLLANPFLAECIRQNDPGVARACDRFAVFHDDLVDAYAAKFSGPGHLLDRMKGFWRYFSHAFSDGRRLLLRIRRTRSLERYRRLVARALAGESRWCPASPGAPHGLSATAPGHRPDRRC